MWFCCVYWNYLSQKLRYDIFSQNFFSALNLPWPCSPFPVSKLFLSFFLVSYPPFDLSQACLCYKACSGHMEPELLEGGVSPTLSLVCMLVCVQCMFEVDVFLYMSLYAVVEEVLRPVISTLIYDKSKSVFESTLIFPAKCIKSPYSAGKCEYHVMIL